MSSSTASSPSPSRSHFSSPDNAGEAKEVAVKLLVVGDHHMGKTTLVQRVAKGKFVQNLLSTIGMDFAVHTWVYKNHPTCRLRIKAEFTDIQGQDYNPHVQRLISKGTKAVVVVTASPLNDQKLKTAGEWLAAAQQALLGVGGLDGVVFEVLINKSDLVDSDTIKHDEAMAREYFLPEGGATKENRCFDPSQVVAVIPTSARSGHNLPKAVTSFVEEVTNRMPDADLKPPVDVPEYGMQRKPKQTGGWWTKC